MFVAKAKSDFAANRMEYLYTATKQQKYCDAVFFVRSRSFYVHMVVLSACSDFFVKNQYKLSATFSPFDFDVIDAILKYCYTGEIILGIDDHHYKKFIELANLLGMEIPPRYKTVDFYNCLEVLKLTGDSKLKKKAMDLTLENFKTLHKTQDFLNLPASSVIEILKSDDLIVPSEEDVFNSVKLWVNYDDASRKIDLAKLMSTVRLSLLSTEFLVEEVMNFCKSCEECVAHLRQIILDKISSNNKSFIQRETPRRRKEIKIALVGGTDIDMANTIDIYDGEKKSWTLSKSIEINKYRFASVIVGDWIVIIGGENSSKQTLTSVDYIDLQNGQKYPLRSLNQARHNLSSVTHYRDSSTDIYAIGGAEVTNIEKYTGHFLASVERWNSKTGEWKIVTPLLVTTDLHSASVIDDNIYLTGGRVIENQKNISTNKVQIYSVVRDSWTYGAQMIQERCDHSSVVCKGKLFVGGGYSYQTDTSTDSVEFYDPIANLWTEFTKLPKPLKSISLCCFRDKILCMGGFDGNTQFNDVWEYDDKSWNTVKSLNKGRTLAVAHVIPYDSII
ncbi:kelch-like protein 25 [Arctopsyche grandis]|uniref:kelch-like protein 25 n=1 Tax=Arctopsyche grandis TaxID=121162 RepID=UPI00406D9ED0